jgi:DNA-damage-inducible protein J
MLADHWTQRAGSVYARGHPDQPDAARGVQAAVAADRGPDDVGAVVDGFDDFDAGSYHGQPSRGEAATVLATMGLTVSDAMRLLLTRVAHEKALPFEPLIPNEATIAAMRETRAGKLETVTPDALRTAIHTDS